MTSHMRVLCCFLLAFQSGAPPAFQQSTAKPQTLAAACQQPCLEDGTPVRLRMSQTVSSADAHVNDRVEFEVLEDIKVAEVIVVPKGGIAWGTVTEAQPKRRMARGGKLEIVMDSVRLTDGQKAALRATKEGKGGGHTGAMVAGIVATGLLFFPAAPFFLFMHGKDITFPKGTEVPTFIDGNFHLNLSKFHQEDAAAAPAQEGLPSSPGTSQQFQTSATVAITSKPVGAEIFVDQNFVGNTPSAIEVPTGKHVISVRKEGYRNWERSLAVSSGTVNLNAELVPGLSTPAANSTVNTDHSVQQTPAAVNFEPRSETPPRPEAGRNPGWIGVTTKDDATRGVVITRVLPGSSASQAGLQVGDVIVELNGKPVKSGMEFDVAIAHSVPGSEIRIAYMRGAWRMEVKMTVGKIG